MTVTPQRILLDTNVFIIGFLDESSPEARILNHLAARPETVILFSSDLEEQLRRVGRRLGNKDWAGFILYLIWRDYAIDYIDIPMALTEDLEKQSDIPREDVGIYLTALLGGAKCFVSANRELVKQVAGQRQDFECLTPENFVAKYVYPNIQ